MKVNQVEIKSVEQRNCERDISSYENSLLGLKDDVLFHKSTLDKSEKFLVTANNRSIDYFFKNERVDRNIRSLLRNSFNNEMAGNRARVRRSTNAIAHAGRKIVDYQKFLTRRKAELIMIVGQHPPRILTQEDVRDKLRDFEHVDLENTYLYHDHGVPELVVRFTGIRCELREKPHGNILDSSWILPDMNVRINLITGLSRVCRLQTEERMPRGWSVNKVHPHIMDGEVPCYGDFLGAANDAKDSQDITEMVTIMQMFLETVNYDDSAGKKYARYLIYRSEGFNSRGVEGDLVNSLERIGGGLANIYTTKVDHPTTGRRVFYVPVVEEGVYSCHYVEISTNHIKEFTDDLRLPKGERKIAISEEQKAANLEVEQARIKKALIANGNWKEPPIAPPQVPAPHPDLRVDRDGD